MRGHAPVRLLIVEDHEVVRSGLKALLDKQRDIAVVGVAETGEDALRALGTLAPDIVLLDYRLPDMTGATVCAEIVRRRPRTRVVILTMFVEDQVLFACLSAGARGFLLKGDPPDVLVDTVRRVSEGQAVLHPPSVERVLEWTKGAQLRHWSNASLAPFELEILRCLSMGNSLREAAGSLRVSEESLKTQVRDIKRRLGASDRAHAVALAVRRGLI